MLYRRAGRLSAIGKRARPQRMYVSMIYIILVCIFLFSFFVLLVTAAAVLPIPMV